MRRALLLLTLTLGACAPATSVWAERVAQADEAGVWAASETALLVVPGNLDPGASPEATAANAAAAAMDPFDPNDCVVATVSGATVSYALDGCSGSFGLVHATGELRVTFVASPDGRTAFHASATDLILNGGPSSFEADAAVRHDVAQGLRTIEVTIDTQGIGPAGTPFRRHGTQTARWLDSWGCLLVDEGADTITVGSTTWQGTTRALSFCVGECPMLGGTLAWSGAAGRVELAYGGAPTLQWSVAGPPAEAGILAISCGL